LESAGAILISVQKADNVRREGVRDEDCEMVKYARIPPFVAALRHVSIGPDRLFALLHITSPISARGFHPFRVPGAAPTWGGVTKLSPAYP